VRDFDPAYVSSGVMNGPKATSALSPYDSQLRTLVDAARQNGSHSWIPGDPYPRKTAGNILVQLGLLCGYFVSRGGDHANNRLYPTRARWNVLDRHPCRCRLVVRELPTRRSKLQLFFVGAMPCHCARTERILRTESISRDGLRHFRRKLECPQLAQALSALLISTSSLRVASGQYSPQE
jgi:hypothetical protein